MDSKINVKILLTRGASVPTYATPGSAAVDLRNMSGESIVIEPSGKVLVPTGIAISPETSGVVAVIAARSGLAIKHGISLSNGIGVIDSDYRGEICVGLINTSNSTYTVAPEERIAQMMFLPVVTAEFLVSDKLDITDRGEGGFGSTGKA